MFGNQEIFFHFPQAAFLIVWILPFFIAQHLLNRWRNKQQHIYASPATLKRLISPRSLIIRNTKIVGWALVWLLCCIALMDPFGNIHYNTSPTEKQSSAESSSLLNEEVIFLVDTSASMGVADGFNGQTRLESAKIVMQEVLRKLKGQTISLYAFTSQLTDVVPPTLDYLFTRLSIHDLHIDEGDVGGTLLVPILTSFKEEALSQMDLKQYTVLMFTDGGDTKLESLQGDAFKQEQEKILSILESPEQSSLKLFTIGLGSPNPTPIPHVNFQNKSVLSGLQSSILEQLASKTGGKFYRAQNWSSWNLSEALVSQINTQTSGSSSQTPSHRAILATSEKEPIVDWYYQLPLGLSLLLYFLNLILPDTLNHKSRLLLIVFFPFFSLTSLENLGTTGKKAEAFADAQGYHEAQELYEGIDIQQLPSWQQARILYNLGTLQLDQKLPIDALSFFQQVHPADLSLPQFGQNLLLNEGIAYLQYAEDISLPKPYRFDIQKFFIEHSLNAFETIVAMNTHQKLPLLEQWKAKAQLQLTQIAEQKHQYETDPSHVVKTEMTSAHVLKNTLKQAQETLLLFLQSAIQEKPDLENLLKNQQSTLMQASSFIAAVLKDQTIQCNSSLWELVIPLYDRGYHAAAYGAELLKQTPINTSSLIANQEQAITDWTQALEFILHPPSPQGRSSSLQQSASSFQNIQEMYLQDQSQPPPETEELHSW